MHYSPTFWTNGSHAAQQFLLLLVRAVLRQLLENVSARNGGNFQVVGQSGTVSGWAGEWMLLAAVRVRIDQGENSVQISIAQLAKLLNQTLVVDGIHCHVVASVVAHLGAFDAQLDVHARAATSLVQLAVDLDGRQEGVLGIERRPLVLDRVEAGDLASVDAIGLHVRLLQQTILTNEHLLAATLNAEVVTDGWPETILPSDEVILNAKRHNGFRNNVQV